MKHKGFPCTCGLSSPNHELTLTHNDLPSSITGKNIYIRTYTGWPPKKSRYLRNYNGAYTSWGEISFGTLVDQYVLLLTYKSQ